MSGEIATLRKTMHPRTVCKYELYIPHQNLTVTAIPVITIPLGGLWEYTRFLDPHASGPRETSTVDIIIL